MSVFGHNLILSTEFPDTKGSSSIPKSSSSLLQYFFKISSTLAAVATHLMLS